MSAGRQQKLYALDSFAVERREEKLRKCIFAAVIRFQLRIIRSVDDDEDASLLGLSADCVGRLSQTLPRGPNDISAVVTAWQKRIAQCARRQFIHNLHKPDFGQMPGIIVGAICPTAETIKDNRFKFPAQLCSQTLHEYGFANPAVRVQEDRNFRCFDNVRDNSEIGSLDDLTHIYEASVCRKQIFRQAIQRIEYVFAPDQILMLAAGTGLLQDEILQPKQSAFRLRIGSSRPIGQCSA